MLSFYQEDIIKLRKLNRYLFLDANKHLTDAYNTFDDCTLNKISQEEEARNLIKSDLNQSPVIIAMPKCNCICNNKDIQSRGRSKFGQNYNTLEKCVCSKVPQASTIPRFRKVLSSNKAYNYTKNLPNNYKWVKPSVPCHCRKGNRCYCCFDSTDAEADDQDDNNPEKNVHEQENDEYCQCGCDCCIEPQNSKEFDGKKKTGQPNDDDEFILFIKDKKKASKGSLEGYKKVFNATRHKINVDKGRVLNEDEILQQRSNKQLGNQRRSNSETSIQSSKNHKLTRDDLDDLNKFREKYYFECHAIPKEQFFRNHRSRVDERSASFDQKNKVCNCKCFNDNMRQARERSANVQKFSCTCQFCTCDKKPYRLNDYNARDEESDGEREIGMEDAYRTKKGYLKDDLPNYTINIPEICFKFPVNGGKIVIDHQGDEIKSKPQGYRNIDDHLRRRVDEQDHMSISLRGENGYECP